MSITFQQTGGDDTMPEVHSEVTEGMIVGSRAWWVDHQPSTPGELPYLRSTITTYKYEGPRVWNDTPPCEQVCDAANRWWKSLCVGSSEARELADSVRRAIGKFQFPPRSYSGVAANCWPEPSFGFYAYKTSVPKMKVLNFLTNTMESNRDSTYVFEPHDLQIKAVGLVKLYGVVMEHDIGFRAQGLVIDRLAVLHQDGIMDEHGWEALCDDLAERYRCDVELSV